MTEDSRDIVLIKAVLDDVEQFDGYFACCAHMFVRLVE
jgi:hypothetical protein